jgi:hypothetical protein
MDIAAQVNKLTEVLPKLGPKDREFALDLCKYFTKYHKLSPKQTPWVEKLIARAEQPKLEPEKIEVGSFDGVVKLFNKAKEKLKYPKIHLMCAGHLVSLAVAGPMSKAPGSINVMGEGKFPNREWFGRVSPDGKWSPSQTIAPDMMTALMDLLKKFGQNPARVAKEHGKLTGNCCFCNSALTDVRSTAAGFGPVCAKNYGLAEEWKSAVKKANLELSAEQDLLAEAFTGFPSNEMVVIEGDANKIEKKLVDSLWTKENESDFGMGVSSGKTGLSLEKLATIYGDGDVGIFKDYQGPDNPNVCYLCEENPGVVEALGYKICKSCADTMEI